MKVLRYNWSMNEILTIPKASESQQNNQSVWSGEESARKRVKVHAKHITWYWRLCLFSTYYMQVRVHKIHWPVEARRTMKIFNFIWEHIERAEKEWAMKVMKMKIKSEEYMIAMDELKIRTTALLYVVCKPYHLRSHSNLAQRSEEWIGITDGPLTTEAGTFHWKIKFY